MCLQYLCGRHRSTTTHRSTNPSISALLVPSSSMRLLMSREFSRLLVMACAWTVCNQILWKSFPGIVFCSSSVCGANAKRSRSMAWSRSKQIRKSLEGPGAAMRRGWFSDLETPIRALLFRKNKSPCRSRAYGTGSIIRYAVSDSYLHLETR